MKEKNNTDIASCGMKVDDAMYKTIIDGTEFSTFKLMTLFYYNVFGEWPYHEYHVTHERTKYTAQPFNDDLDDEEFDIDIDYEIFHERLTALGYVRVELDYDNVYVNVDRHIVLSIFDCIKCITSRTDVDDELKRIQSCIELYEHKTEKIEIGILCQRNGGFNIEETELDIMDIDVDKTYNDDIPIEAIDDFITKEKTGLALFYGEPGTGKTTYIRNLIQKHTDKHFVILDSNLLYNITSNSLLNIFIHEKNAIYVVEDCEKLLVSRDNEQNPIISAFLNMTDGILANVINCKFICTFNTDLNNIDEAIKRKGRMKLKYEFKKLSKDKVHKILNDKNEDMIIADVIFAQHENDYTKNNRRKIGFNV